MESREIIASLISTGITAISIVLIWLLKILITKTMNKNNKLKEDLNLENIVSFVLEAENKLGTGQGKAKLLYVLSKLGKKENDRKAIKKVNEVHKIIETAAEKGN